MDEFDQFLIELIPRFNQGIDRKLTDFEMSTQQRRDSSGSSSDDDLYAELRKLIPIKKGIHPLGFSQKDRIFIQNQMWRLYNRGNVENRDISWSEIYQEISKMKKIHRKFTNTIGPICNSRRKGKKPFDQEHFDILKRILIIGDVDYVMDYFYQH